MSIKKMFLAFLATLVGEGRMTIDDFFLGQMLHRNISAGGYLEQA
jgi:hypothetical protein